MAAGTCVKLMVVVVLCFSHLFCINGAIPITRSANLVMNSQKDVVADKLMRNYEESLKMNTMVRRMDIELNDYPGSGANNRHTPKAHEIAAGRGCIDC